MNKVEKNMFHLFLPHLPDPPASILAVWRGAGSYFHDLVQRGYQVTVVGPSKRSADFTSRDHCSDRSCPVSGFFDCDNSGFPQKPYDAILFLGSLKSLDSLACAFEQVRILLKPGGKAVILDQICYDPSFSGKTGIHLLRNIIAALYENGFNIKSNEKAPEEIEKKHDNLIEEILNNSDLPIYHPDTDSDVVRLEYLFDLWKSKRSRHEQDKVSFHLIVAGKDKVFLRAYRDGDEATILPMFRKVFNSERTIEHWYWKFRDNPFGKHKIALAVTQDGSLAAHFCAYPVPFHSSLGDPEVFLSFHGADTMTNPEFRRLGLGKTSVLGKVTAYFYNKFCIDNIPFMYGYNTGNIRKFGERFLKYRYTSHIPYHVMDLAKKTLKPSNGLGRAFSGLKVEKVSSITEEYDLFFDKVCEDYGILVQRKSAYLKWRYLDCPDNVHELFALRRFGRLVGWSVFSFRKNVLLWGDALFHKRYAHNVGFMLGHLLKRFYNDVNRIEGWFSKVPDWWTNTLQVAGFEVMREPDNLAAGYRMFDDSFSKELFERSNYYTMGDSDLF